MDLSVSFAVFDRAHIMTHKVTSVGAYAAVFAALLVLTVTTVAVSKIELGEYNFVCAMTIAVLKAMLVVLFFMHVKGSSATTKLFIASGLFWLSIMLVFFMGDYMTRGWLSGVLWW
jgi:cytochrome c oxidase subunit 4